MFVKLYPYHILGLPTSPSSASRDAIVVAPVVRQGTIPLLRYIRRGLTDFNQRTLRGAIYFRDPFLGWPVMPRLTEGLAYEVTSYECRSRLMRHDFLLIATCFITTDVTLQNNEQIVINFLPVSSRLNRIAYEYIPDERALFRAFFFNANVTIYNVFKFR